ncbi:cytochrome c3 family protein [Yoonia sp. R2-816]|uniref:cytochrome c3 family protein n=1 Tax=Yoonia sp. R2-816 TaxID=3342638 RepID=UPI003727370A
MACNRSLCTRAATLLVAATMWICIGSAGAADDNTLATTHAYAGLSCMACHVENPPAQPVATETCTVCHGLGQSLAETTAEIEPNPHASHKGDLPCASCHRMHGASVDACAGCHSWGYTVP